MGKVKPGAELKPEAKSRGIWEPDLYVHTDGATLPVLRGWLLAQHKPCHPWHHCVCLGLVLFRCMGVPRFTVPVSG